MDTNTAVVIVVIILAAVAVYGLWRFSQKGKASIKVGSIGMDVEGSAQSEPAAKIVDSESREGGALAEDTTGRGAAIEHTRVKDDLIASSGPPPKGDAPKA